MNTYLKIVTACLMSGFIGSAQATTIYANTVHTILRGDTSIGEFPDYYGGTFPGTFPVVLTEAQAKSAVLGSPDGRFLSLPGDEANNPTPTGSPFQWSYVEVGFGTNFDHTWDLVITELGDAPETAQIFLWFAGGGNIQFDMTSGASDDNVIDLSGYAGLTSTYGDFSKVGIGGQDLVGGSMGFDLDAVGISAVPVPAAAWLFASGLMGLAGVARRKSSRLN